MGQDVPGDDDPSSSPFFANFGGQLGREKLTQGLNARISGQGGNVLRRLDPQGLHLKISKGFQDTPVVAADLHHSVMRSQPEPSDDGFRQPSSMPYHDIRRRGHVKVLFEQDFRRDDFDQLREATLLT